MIVQDIYLEDYDWNVRVYYAVDEYFISNILIDLVELGCEEDVYFKIKSLMESGKNNIGFTYSNSNKKATLMLIGIADSADEFQSTFDHEKNHLAMHICNLYKIDLFSEEYQYLIGEIGKKLFKVAKKFLCDHCRQNMLY